MISLARSLARSRSLSLSLSCLLACLLAKRLGWELRPSKNPRTLRRSATLVCPSLVWLDLGARSCSELDRLTGKSPDN